MDLQDIKLNHHYLFESIYAGTSRMKALNLATGLDSDGNQFEGVRVQWMDERSLGRQPGCAEIVVHPNRFVRPWHTEPFPFEVGTRVRHKLSPKREMGTVVDIREGHWDCQIDVDYDGLGSVPTRPDEVEPCL